MESTRCFFSGAAYCTDTSEGVNQVLAIDLLTGATTLTATALSRGELFLVCIAGAIWGILNGCFAVLFGWLLVHGSGG